jgi:hypothetical protein
VRRYTRRERTWGGAAWTDPIPVHPRVAGDFRWFSWRDWTLVENARTGEVSRLRADREGRWAEVIPA